MISPTFEEIVAMVEAKNGDEPPSFLVRLGKLWQRLYAHLTLIAEKETKERVQIHTRSLAQIWVYSCIYEMSRTLMNGERGLVYFVIVEYYWDKVTGNRLVWFVYLWVVAWRKSQYLF